LSLTPPPPPAAATARPAWWCASATHPSIHHQRPSPPAPISPAIPARLHPLVILLAAPFAYLAVVLLPDVLPAALLLLLCFPSPSASTCCSFPFLTFLLLLLLLLPRCSSSTSELLLAVAPHVCHLAAAPDLPSIFSLAAADALNLLLLFFFFYPQNCCCSLSPRPC
uniref:Uncharacterized protein n=1 Tax=Aegilops tauschii subsp. strangulata TaxID=200361 RepID=A0A453ERN0_AEGTS